METPPTYDQLYPPVAPLQYAVFAQPPVQGPSQQQLDHLEALHALLPQQVAYAPSYATIAATAQPQQVQQQVVVQAIPVSSTAPVQQHHRPLQVHTAPPPRPAAAIDESLPCPRFVDIAAVDFRRQIFNAFYDCLYPFQQEALKKCIAQNSILYLPTGAGKTVVAAALAAYQIACQPTKKIVFVVNRVPLISQQSAVLKTVKSLRVAEVCSERKDANCWEDVLRRFDAVVIIDALFYNWLISTKRDSPLLSDVSLLVLDEVHHARKMHFYSKILRLVSEHQPAPAGGAIQILGLSASPAAREDKARTRRALEDLMILSRSVLVAVEREMDDLVKRVSVPKSTLVEYLYSNVEAVTDDLMRSIIIAIEEDVFPKISLVNREVGDAFKSHLIGIPHGSRPYVDRCRSLETCGASTNNVGQKLLARFLGRINMAIILMEEASLMEACRWILSDDVNLEFFFAIGSDDSRHEDSLTDQVIAHLAGPLVAQVVEFLRFLLRTPKRADYDTSSKMSMLWDVLEKLDVTTPTFRGIVFCDTKAATFKIVQCMKSVPALAALNPRWFVGHSRTLVEDGDKYRTMSMTDSQQQQCLQDFRQGRTRLLIATSVAEEGLDIPICSLVIRYEGAFSVQSFIQSRGRARQAGANFIVISKLSGLNPFRQVLLDIKTQDEVIREIISEDQNAIISGRAETSERAFWEVEPRYFLDLFSQQHGVRILTDVHPAAFGVQCTKYVDIDYCGDGRKRRLVGIGLGSEKKASDVAEHQLCKELYRLSLLPSSSADLSRQLGTPVERETYSYLSSSTVALSSVKEVRFDNQNEAQAALVSEYIADEWQGPRPYELLLNTTYKKKLPYDKVQHTATVTSQGLTHVKIVFPTRSIRGEIVMKQAEKVDADQMVALQSAAIAALGEHSVQFVRRAPGSL